MPHQTVMAHSDDPKSSIAKVAERPVQSILENCCFSDRSLDPNAKFCPCCGRRVNKKKIQNDAEGKPLSCGPWHTSAQNDRYSPSFADPFNDLGMGSHSKAFHPPKPISSHRVQHYAETSTYRGGSAEEAEDTEQSRHNLLPRRSASELSHYHLRQQNNRYMHLRGKPRCPPRVTTPEITIQGAELQKGRNAKNAFITTPHSPNPPHEPSRARSISPVGASQSILALKLRFNSEHTDISKSLEMEEKAETRPDTSQNKSSPDAEHSGQMPLKHVVVSPQCEPSVNETKRDTLGWGKRCKAAQRLSVYVHKGVSGDLVESEEPLKFMSTVNLLCPEPSTILNVSREDVSTSQDLKHSISAENSSVSLAKSTAASLTVNRTLNQNDLVKKGSKSPIKKGNELSEDSLDPMASSSKLPFVVGSAFIGSSVSLDDHKSSQSSVESKDSGDVKSIKRMKAKSQASDWHIKEKIRQDVSIGQPHVPRESGLPSHNDTEDSSFFLTSTAEPNVTHERLEHSIIQGENFDKHVELGSNNGSKALKDGPMSFTFLGPEGSHPAHLLGGILVGQAPPGRETTFTSFALNLVRERRLPRDIGCATMPMHLYDQQMKATLKSTQELIEEMHVHHERKQESRKNFVSFRKKGQDEVAKEALQRFIYGRMVQLWMEWRDLTLEGRNLRALKSRIQAPRPAHLPGLLQPKLVRHTMNQS